MAPLYLKRVATVVSLRQLEGSPAPDSAEGGDTGPTAPVSGCAGSKFPRYSFAVKDKAKFQRIRSRDDVGLVPDMDDFSDAGDFAGDSDDSLSSDGSMLEVGVVPQKSLLDSVLMALWEDCAEQGLFRYDVTECPTKVVPGVYGFVAQLNEGRATKKRATEFRVDQVCQDFDPSKFNFQKAYMREVLFQFEPASSSRSNSHGHAPPAESHFSEASRAGRSPNLVVINVSPIEYGHVLLVPRALDNLPQLMDGPTTLLALQFAAEADNPYFRVGYNSLGAYATINHLHFQAYYLAAPFPVERAPTVPLKGLRRKRELLGGAQVSRLADYPVNGFVVEGEDLQEVAALVATAAVRMQDANVPHNVLISDAGARVFIFPQCYAEKQAQGLVPEALLDSGVNPAVWEIAGHLVMKRSEDYDNLTQDFAWDLLAEVSLPEERFLQVAQLCFGGLASEEPTAPSEKHLAETWPAMQAVAA